MLNHAMIEDLLRRKPGLTEGQIAFKLFAHDAQQRQEHRLASDCKWLIRQGRLRRRGSGRPGDAYRYYISGGGLEAASADSVAAG